MANFRVDLAKAQSPLLVAQVYNLCDAGLVSRLRFWNEPGRQGSKNRKILDFFQASRYLIKYISLLKEGPVRLRALVLVSTILAFMLLLEPAAAQEKVAGTYGQGPEVFTLATGSPGELGLLKTLGEAFAKEQGGKTSLHWIKAGSGASLQLLKDKKVDMIMVHAPKAEKKAMDEAWATKRTLIGSNEFFIVGPPRDPAKIKEAKSAADA
jgi:hypothetical protein